MVRDARREDVPHLMSLLAELGHPAGAREVAARLDDLLGRGATDRVLVAEARGAVVGFVTLHATPVLHRPTAVGRITALVVAAEHRGTGLGAALVRAGERILIEAGCARIEVTTAHPRAHGFYRRLGYDDAGVRFAREVSGAG